ncbi:MAG TPA: DegT/DnrJ/EryC1/StrS family aminotransferase [Gaiellales bacterium]|nr:DegT/DnrJ/EryC1/StrS family aminotransferase [Gaiellales bacterium]
MTETRIPLVDLKAQYATLADDVQAAFNRVEERQYFIGGPETKAFEEEYAAACEASRCVAVSSGTSALELTLQALGVGAGDEVITVSHTFFATIGAILRCGATPVFVDVDPHTWTMSPEAVGQAVGPKTRAILAVHLYGNPVDMAAIASAAPGIPIIEDAAQAHGARYDGGPVGHAAAAACYSFYPGKTLGAHGDAGAVTTNDEELAQRIRELRDHGRAGGKYEHIHLGTNARVSEIQAAVLRAKLPHLAEWVKRRQALSAIYEEALAPAGFPVQRVAASAEHGRHLFVVLHDDRDAARAALSEAGIATGVHYPIPCHRQPVMDEQPSRTVGTLEVTDDLAGRCLSLPLYPELDDADAARIAQLLIEASQPAGAGARSSR